MKMSRSDLKGLIKECIVEILQEGLGTSLQTETTNSARLLRPQQRKNTPELSQQKRNQNNTNSLTTNALKNAVLETANGNSIMADILADTALTTLPTMLSSENKQYPSMPPDPAMANFEPTEVFGENVDKWAKLAFNHSGPKYTSGVGLPLFESKLSDAELDAPALSVKK